MKLQQALTDFNHKKDSVFIVYDKKTKNVLYIGESANDAKKAETTKSITLNPLIKHEISKQKQVEYLSNPSLYSL